MKFNFCVGNPPYQETMTTTRDKPIYHLFMKEAQALASKVEFITPARFLFNAGATPKAWNQNILNDEHFKVIEYHQKSADVFPNTDIKGGVAITYYDETKNYEKVRVFSQYHEQNLVKNKVVSASSFIGMDTITASAFSYKFTKELHHEHPEIRYKEDIDGNNIGIFTKDHDYDISSNVLEKLDNLVMFDSKPDDGNDYICIIGRKNSKRTKVFMQRKYLAPHPNFSFYKVCLPKADGTGALGEILTMPFIAPPDTGLSHSFIQIGRFRTEKEAECCIKYIKTKFVRFLLSVVKKTQDNAPIKWKYVPLQNFTSNSDINWSQSIPDIDKQLYAKYGLSQEEIDFIETHVKPME